MFCLFVYFDPLFLDICVASPPPLPLHYAVFTILLTFILVSLKVNDPFILALDRDFLHADTNYPN